MIGRRRRAEHPDDLCECDHTRAAHEHYRAGTDCGACGRRICPAFRLATAQAPRAAAVDEVPPTADVTA